MLHAKLRRGEREVVVNAAKCFLRSGLFDGRPQRAKDLIDGECLGVVLEPVEVDDLVVQLSRDASAPMLPAAGA